MEVGWGRVGVRNEGICPLVLDLEKRSDSSDRVDLPRIGR